MSYFSRAGNYVYSTVTSCGQSIAGFFDALNRTLECCDANSFQFNDGLRFIAAGLQYTGMNVLLASSNVVRSINIAGTAFLSIHMFAAKKINDESCGAPKGHGVISPNILILTTAATLHYIGKEMALVIGQYYNDKELNKRVDYQLENLRNSLLNVLIFPHKSGHQFVKL